MRKLAWVLPIVGLVAAGGWWTVQALSGEDAGVWTSVTRDDLVLGVEVTGTLQAIDTDVIGPPQLRNTWQYKISQLAPEGEDVDAGTVVVGFDASELHQRLQREKAEAQAARKRVEKAEKELEANDEADELRLAEAQGRLRKAALKVDRPQELESARELATYRLDLELAGKEVAFLERKLDASRRSADAHLAALRNQLIQAERKVERTESDIVQMSRKAERDGTVIYTSNWRGEKKQVGDSCWRGESVIELPDLERMQATGQVHEADAGRLAEGQRVTLRLDAHPDVEFSGRVASIWRTVRQESWRSPLKVVKLEIDLDETDTRRMRPGMRFRGKVEIERVEQALLVDLETVFLEADGPVCYRPTWRGHEAVPVELGRRNDRKVEVLSGLEVGDLVSRIDLGDRRRGG